jgi:hypothetical protein
MTATAEWYALLFKRFPAGEGSSRKEGEKRVPFFALLFGGRGAGLRNRIDLLMMMMMPAVSEKYFGESGASVLRGRLAQTGDGFRFLGGAGNPGLSVCPRGNRDADRPSPYRLRRPPENGQPRSEKKPRPPLGRRGLGRAVLF